LRANKGADPCMVKAHIYGEADDGELLCWSAHGDRRGFDEIVLRHGGFALSVAIRVVPDRRDAEDIVQEAMVRAWNHVSDFDPARAQFRTWLYRIVVNLSIDRRRRGEAEPGAMPEDFDAIDPGEPVDEILAASERDAALATALLALPDQQREAMMLVYDKGLSGAEAARILGLSARAMERLLMRARTTLRERLLTARDRKED
jgi:RNA polymerase sigma-70 factor, ECF subfamily